MTFILAASGKKQSGKDSLLSGIRPFLEQMGSVRTYSFADELKIFLINGMGLRWEQVWGTDEQKNSLTEYQWENMPQFIRWDFNGRWMSSDLGCQMIQMDRLDKAIDIEKAFWDTANHPKGYSPANLKNGFMTARELMQVFGTDLMRRMFTDQIWVNACMRGIARDKPAVALIPDLRFPSEFRPFYSIGACIVRLMRDVSKGDQHPSETALDGWQWDQYERVLVIPPDATIENCRQMTLDWLTKRIVGI